ncbi:MAG: oxidoreductase [Porticoccaceae bacterium]|nr:MAG: oxidoreductase [Porticoccaceae bacterium]
MSAAIPVVVAGTGHGGRVHVPALRQAGFGVVGLVGRDAERTRRRAERLGIPAAFTDLDEAIARTGARAATVATPPHSHGDLVRIALDRGCHVLCEKPFARDAEEARFLLDAAERAGVVHLVGHQMRLSPPRAAAALALARGEIGAPKLVTLVQQVDLLHRGIRWPTWWTDPGAGGGWLGAAGSHAVDQIRHWLGEFHTVAALLPRVALGEGCAEDSFDIHFTLRCGASGVLQQTAAARGPWTSLIRVVGSRGTLAVEEGQAWIADEGGRRVLAPPPELAPPALPAAAGVEEALLAAELPPAIHLCEGWRRLIEGRNPLPVALATFADGVACMEVLDAVRRSARDGGARVVAPL